MSEPKQQSMVFPPRMRDGYQLEMYRTFPDGKVKVVLTQWDSAGFECNSYGPVTLTFEEAKRLRGWLIETEPEPQG